MCETSKTYIGKQSNIYSGRDTLVSVNTSCVRGYGIVIAACNYIIHRCRRSKYIIERTTSPRIPNRVRCCKKLPIYRISGPSFQGSQRSRPGHTCQLHVSKSSGPSVINACVNCVCIARIGTVLEITSAIVVRAISPGCTATGVKDVCGR